MADEPLPGLPFGDVAAPVDVKQAPVPPEPLVEPIPDEAEQQRQAREAREAAGRVARQRRAPEQTAPKPSTAVPEGMNPYAAAPDDTPQDNGPADLERTRLNVVNSYYRGTAAGAAALSLWADVYNSEDPPDMAPEMKEARQRIRDQYETVLEDLMTYDMMPTWSGLPQLGAAIGGTVAGAIISPESFLGWAAKGATWTARTINAAIQQGLISGVTDPVIQTLNIDAGAQKDWDYWQSALAFPFGAVLGGGFHVAGEGVGHLIGQRELRKQLFDLSQWDADMPSAAYPSWALDPRNGIVLPEAGRMPEPVFPPPAREAGAAVEPAPPAPKPEPAPDLSFSDVVKDERARLSDSYGAAQPGIKRLNEEARFFAFEKEAGDTLRTVIQEHHIEPEAMSYTPGNNIWDHYDRAAGESVPEAVERAIAKWVSQEERLALQDVIHDSQLKADLEEWAQAYDTMSGQITAMQIEAGKMGPGGVRGAGQMDRTLPAFNRFYRPPHLPEVPDDIPFGNERFAAPEGRDLPEGGRAQPGAEEGTARAGDERAVRGGGGGAGSETRVGAEVDRGEKLGGPVETLGGKPLATERTAQGEQTLIPGVAPITDRQRAESGMAAPLRGGDRAPPAGGLFDADARAQADMFSQTAQSLGISKPGEVLPLMPEREFSRLPGEERRDPDLGVPSEQVLADTLGVTPESLSTEQKIAVKSLQQQAVALANALDIPLRQGRLETAGALGEFKTGPGVARVKELADFEAVKHELAHGLEQKLGDPLRGIISVNSFELGRLDYDTTRADPREGFAEWMRMRITSPNLAANKAPNFSLDFNAMLSRERPAIRKLIDQAAAAHRAWNEATSSEVAAALVRDTIPDSGFQKALTTVQENGLPQTTNTLMGAAYQHMIDRFAPMERAVREMATIKQEQQGGGLVNLLASNDPSVLIRSAQRSNSAAYIEWFYGIVPYRDLTPQGPSLKDIYNTAFGNHIPLFAPWNKDTVRHFDQYLMARMSDYLWRRFYDGLEGPNAPSPMKWGDARQLIAEMEQAHPTFVRAAEMLQEMIGNVRKKKYDAGLWSQDIYDKTSAYEFYVPMRRVFEGEDTGLGPSRRDQSTIASQVRRRRGSERDVESPLRNIMMDIMYMEQDIRRNEIIKAIDALASSIPGEGGKYAERLPAHIAKKYTTRLDEMIKAKAEEVGLDPAEVRSWIEQLSDGEPELIGNYWRMEQSAAAGDPVVFLWEGGSPVPIQLMSERTQGPHRLYELVTELPQPILDVWVNALTVGANTLRTGVVGTPAFVIANYIRDQQLAAMANPGYIPFVGGLPGILSEVRGGEAARNRAYLGGVMGGWLVGEVERKVEASIMDMRKQGYLVRTFSSFRGLMESMQITEAGTRNSIWSIVYKQKLREGLSSYEAGWEASKRSDDIMDFSRRGDRMQAVLRMTPFLNPSIQGTDRYLFRQLLEDPLRHKVTFADVAARNRAIYSYAAIAVTSALGAAWAALNWENEAYRDARPELMGTHLIVPNVAGEVGVWPLPFDFGFGFVAGQYAYKGLVKDDPRAALQLAEAIWAAMGPPNPVTNVPIVTPILETVSNYSFFRKGPIVPDRYRNPAYPELEYSPSTSAIAKEIGRITGWSPMKVDYMVGSVFGTQGRDLMSLSSLVDQDSPAQALDQAYLISRFLKDAERISGRTKQFWELMAHKTGKYPATADAYRRMLTTAVESGQPPIRATEMLNKLSASERVYVTLQEGANAQGRQAFSPDDRRLHPLTRAQKAVGVLNDLAMDVVTNTVIPYRATERLQLSPQQRRQLIDDIQTLAGTEMRNALVMVDEPGYANRPIIDTQPHIDVIEKVSPNVAQEIRTRYATAKVYTTEAVREAWPQLRDEIVTYGSAANIRGVAARARAQGYEFGAHRTKKPPVVRRPIEGQPASVTPPQP